MENFGKGRKRASGVVRCMYSSFLGLTPPGDRITKRSQSRLPPSETNRFTHEREHTNRRKRPHLLQSTSLFSLLSSSVLSSPFLASFSVLPSQSLVNQSALAALLFSR